MQKLSTEQGFTRCSDCDVDLVDNCAEAVRHPLAKKVAVGTNMGRGCGGGRTCIFMWGFCEGTCAGSHWRTAASMMTRAGESRYWRMIVRRSPPAQPLSEHTGVLQTGRLVS